MSVEVAHLRHVVAAATHGSFRRAATALNIAQPTLSKRVREIEARLGVSLFDRSTAGARLTDFGEDFVASAHLVLAELEAIEARAKSAKCGNIGRLKIGFYTSLSTGKLRDVVFSFAERFSHVEVNLVERPRAALIPLLDRRLIDIAIVLGEASKVDYAHMTLWSERIMVAFPKEHHLAARDFLYWTDVKNERFLLSRHDPGPEIEGVILKKLSCPGDRPLIKRVEVSNEHILSAVDGNRGVTVLCESSTGHAPPGVIFREVRDGSGSSRLRYVAYWRHNNDNPTLKQFLASLQRHPVATPVNPTVNG